MTELRIREMLRELADPLPPAELVAADLWQQGTRQRRWARAGLAAGASALATVAIVAAVTMLSDTAPHQPLPGDPLTTRAVVDGVIVDVAPPVAVVDQLDRLDTVLSPDIQLDATRARQLSEAPVARALALVRVLNPTREGAADVFIIGADQSTRIVDLDNLRLAGDVNPRSLDSVEIRNTSLSPDGTRVALVNRDEQAATGVLVIDLAAGEAIQFALPEPLGYHARALWSSDGREILVEDHQNARTVLVGVEDGDVSSYQHGDLTSPYGGVGVVAAAPATVGRDVVRLGGAPEEEPALWRWTPHGELVSHRILPGTELAPYGWDWGSSGWQHGNLVARSMRAGPPPDHGSVVTVVDIESGNLVRALRMPSSEASTTTISATVDRATDCCPVLGWLDHETVLVSDAGLLAWNIRTGQLHLVSQARGPAGTPIGYSAVGDLSR